jgi:hypothetical protein
MTRFVVCDLSNKGAQVYCGPDKVEAMKAFDSLRFAYLNEQAPWGNKGWQTVSSATKVR